MENFNKNNFEKTEDGIFKKNISEEEKNFLKKTTELPEGIDRLEDIYGSDKDSSDRVTDDIISERLEKYDTVGQSLNQLTVHEVIKSYIDTISALESQLDYHDQKINELYNKIRDFQNKEYELSDKVIVLKGQNIENKENIIKEMNELAEQLDALEKKYEVMVSKTEKMKKITELKLNNLYEALSYSYETARSFDPERESPDKTYLKN